MAAFSSVSIINFEQVNVSLVSFDEVWFTFSIVCKKNICDLSLLMECLFGEIVIL